MLVFTNQCSNCGDMALEMYLAMDLPRYNDLITTADGLFNYKLLIG